MGHAAIKKKVNFAAIFSTFRLGPYQLKNRLVALPVYTGYAYPDGRVSPQLIGHYTKLAQSGAAMVVVANAAVAADGVTKKGPNIDGGSSKGSSNLMKTSNLNGLPKTVKYLIGFLKASRPATAAQLSWANGGAQASSAGCWAVSLPAFYAA